MEELVEEIIELSDEDLVEENIEEELSEDELKEYESMIPQNFTEEDEVDYYD